MLWTTLSIFMLRMPIFDHELGSETYRACLSHLLARPFKNLDPKTYQVTIVHTSNTACERCVHRGSYTQVPIIPDLVYTTTYYSCRSTAVVLRVQSCRCTPGYSTVLNLVCNPPGEWCERVYTHDYTINFNCGLDIIR